jgi:hypothetical protein
MYFVAIYTKQKMNGIEGRSLDMKIFIKDILQIENELGGNSNNFKVYIKYIIYFFKQFSEQTFLTKHIFSITLLLSS